jgi:hypothetical protein
VEVILKLNTKLTYLLVILSFIGCNSSQDTEQAKINKILPAIIELTGIQHSDSVKMEWLTKAELKKFLENSFDLEYPNEDLTKRGNCFSEIGLLPKGYNLRNGILNLTSESAAIYDQNTKALKIVSDLSREQKEKLNYETIIAHEITHALIDGVVDLNSQWKKGLKNIDYEYTFRAINEGVAGVVMFSYKDDLPLDKMHNVKKFWDRSLVGPSFRNCIYTDRYVNEYWLRPYVNGCDFVEAWLKANPHKKLIDLLKNMPSTSEQILHFDKYAQRDEPTEIDISKVKDVLSKVWELYYSNTLGEFDLLKLFENFYETKYDADTIAVGWDGCRFEAYKDKDERLILFGSSVWDTGKDAQEFCTGFKTVLKIFRNQGDFTVEQHDKRVDFVIGLIDKVMVGKIMSVLNKSF